MICKSISISGSQGRPDSRCGVPPSSAAPPGDLYGYSGVQPHSAVVADIPSQPNSAAPVAPRIRQLQQQLSKAKVSSGDPTSPDFSPRGSLV